MLSKVNVSSYPNFGAGGLRLRRLTGFRFARPPVRTAGNAANEAAGKAGESVVVKGGTNVPKAGENPPRGKNNSK